MPGIEDFVTHGPGGQMLSLQVPITSVKGMVLEEGILHVCLSTKFVISNLNHSVPKSYAGNL